MDPPPPDENSWIRACTRNLYFMESGGGRVVKLLACGVSGPGSIPGLATWISDIGYILLPSRDMAG